MTDQAKHEPRRVFVDPSGDGFVIECSCGEQTPPEMEMRYAGCHYDDHLNEMGVHPYFQHEAGFRADHVEDLS